MARRKKRILGSLALVAAGMVVGWWLARQSLPLIGDWRKPAEPATAGDIRSVDFRNFTYSAYCAMVDDAPMRITVSDGEYRREEMHDQLHFSVLSVSHGDLDGDGHAEAAVATNCNSGGTGQFTEGMVFTLHDGRPRLIARVEGGDRAFGGIAGLSIENGRLLVERYATDEEGPACCPKYIETTRLRWNGDRMVREGGITRRAVAND